MKTHTLAIKHSNYASIVPHNIKATITTDDTIQTTHPFEDDRQLTADNCIQKQKPASTKNGKRTMGQGLTVKKIAPMMSNTVNKNN